MTALDPSVLPAGGSHRASPLARLVLSEARLYAREPGTWFFAVALPALILTILGVVMPWAKEPSVSQDGGVTITMISAYAPSVLMLATVTVALNTYPVTVATYRQRGVLRRLSTTPVPPTRLLAAQVLVHAAALVVAAVLAVALGMLVAGVQAPASPGVVLAGFVLGALACFGIGSLVAALAPTSGAATGIGTTLMFLGMFLSGVWLPLPLMPELVQTIASYLPPGAAAQVMLAGWAAEPLPVRELVVLGAWALAGVPLAGRLFRWGS